MKLSIRMKIFLPVMVLLIAFPMAVWLMFRYALEMHMNYNARRSLDWAINRIEDIIDTGDSFLEEFGEEISGPNVETRMLAVSDDYQLL